MCAAFSGIPSAMKVRDGVSRTPVCLPTSERRTPRALSSAAAVSARWVSSPRTV